MSSQFEDPSSEISTPVPVTPSTRETVRVMHFADVHLGVETHGKINPETGLNTRLEDFTKSLNDAVERALQAEVDIALFSGDAYKVRDPNQTHQKLFALALRRLTDNGVPVVLLIGNHDIPNTRGKAHALEIYGVLGGAGVTILASPEVVTIRTRRGVEVLVAGLPYLTRSRVVVQDEAKNKSVEDIANLIRERYASYLADLSRTVAQQPEKIALLMGHFTVENAQVGVQGFLNNPNEPKVPTTAFLVGHPPAFDYVAMGHVHKFQDMNRGNQPPIVYSGSIDRIDFGERIEQKGFVLADVRKGNAIFKHVPLETRRFLLIETDAGSHEDPTAAILNEIQKHPVRDSVVKLSYKVANDRASLVRHEDIRKALAGAHVVVSLQREQTGAEGNLRMQDLNETLTPEKALAMYLEQQARLAPRKDELMAAARVLFERLETVTEAIT